MIEHSRMQQIGRKMGLPTLIPERRDAWFMGGDFHILAETHEKLGGRPPENNAMLEFQEMIHSF